MTSVLCALGPLAAVSVLFSEMPRQVAWPLALLALGYGYWLARREARIPGCEFVWPDAGPVTLDGEAIEGVSLQWRGPLAFMAWHNRGGQRHRLGWWPDTLDSRARRELRLAVDRQAASRRTSRMAG